MAELLIGLLQLTAGSLHARPLAETELELAGEPLPPPIIPGNYDKAAASCLMNVSTLWVVAHALCAPGALVVLGAAGGWSPPVPVLLPLTCVPPASPAVPPQRAFEGVVVEKQGFAWVNERPDAKSANDEKWGWIASTPGAPGLLVREL